jgi:L,D-peptidoglycan transpeptidase YkuD (ErfK/YbiS/YcfS/YnhG family)
MAGAFSLTFLSAMSRRFSSLRTFVARWRWRLFAGVFSVTLVACAGFLVWPIAAGYTEAPTLQKSSAWRALEDARKAAAERWAPDFQRGAESAMRVALSAYRREEVRLLPFRDFRPVRIALQAAEDKARRAQSEGNQKRLDAKARADEALAESEDEVARCTDVGEAMHLGPYTRTLLQKSTIALREARAIYARGDFPAAEDRAEEASAQARAVSRHAVDAASRYADASLVARWRRMIDETVRWSQSSGGTAIVVLKENHRLDLYDNGRVVRSYTADMGYRSVNDKLASGDAATPEGRYRITAKKAASTYYKAMLLDYPNAEDRARFAQMKQRGQIPRGVSVGGLIEIHGDGGRGKDWTKGCVAISNRDIDDLYRRVGVGTPVTIVGGDGQGRFARLVREHGAAVSGTQ